MPARHAINYGPPAGRAGQPDEAGLAVPLLTTAPALLEPFHEPGPGTRRRPRPAVTDQSRPPGRATGHVPPAGQGPHRAGKHDHEAGHADQGQLGDDAGQEEAHAEQEADRRLDHPALVVHPWIFRAHRLRELRILGIERTLDLIELTLLVLRQRHGASHETSRAGTGAMSSSHGPGFLFPEYESGWSGWKGSERVKDFRLLPAPRTSSGACRSLLPGEPGVSQTQIRIRSA